MFQSLSKEAMAALVNGDSGFREYIATLPESERNLIAAVLESPEILNTLLASLSSEQQSKTRSILDDITDVPNRALKLYEQCRFLEARELLHKTIDLYELPSGLPLDGIVKAAGFVVERVKALCHEMLGDVENALGNIPQAGEHHQMALELARQCGDRDTEAKALHGLGCYFWQLGDYEQALEYSRAALDVLQGRSDRWSLACKALNTLSLIHGELSQVDEALDHGRQALAIAEESGDENILPTLLSNRSVQLTSLGLFDEVKPLLDRALAIAAANGMLRQEALIHHNLGMQHLNTATDAGKLEVARHHSQLANEISQKIGVVSLEALACSGMAHALVMGDDYAGAESQYRRAVKLYQDISAVADAADSLVDLGNLLRFCRNEPEEALDCYKKAITLTEQVRSRLKRESHRIGLAEARTEPYHQVITMLIELGRVDEAFNYLERSRSKTLLELLAGQFSTDSGNETFRKIAERAKRIDELRHTLDQIQKAEEIGSVAGSEETARRTAIRGEVQQGLEQEERQFATLCEELQRIAPEQHGLVAIQASDSTAVQSVLPADTAVVELYQTNEQLLFFVIRPGSPVKVIAVELTADDAAAMVFSYIMALRDPATLDTSSHDYLRSVRQPASRLYNAIFGPLVEILDGVQRLVIVPHLFWHYLPFHTLYDTISKWFLLDRFEISYAPSASVLEVCRKKQRHKRDTALILCRNDGDLPHVETEGIAIGKVFDNASFFYGSEAALDRVSRQACPDVIHCACHGYFDPEQPFLSGIAIPPDTNEDRPTLLMDILGLKLESSLVTLSACDTGLNRISNADELVGLSRGFFGAGATALLLSLWKVSDSSTAYLMENFYWHYVANRQTKGKALQLAMQAVRAKQEFSHPYYWAPFVVMGEWG